MKPLISMFWMAALLGAQEPAKPAPEPAKTEAAAPAKEAGESALSGSVDVGYRFRSDVAGNLNAYRTAVNLGEGPKVFGFDLRLTSSTRKYFDKITVFGAGWGGDPYTTGRFNAQKERAYELNVDYKNIAYFNFLPTFANPLLERGIAQTNQGFDVRRKMFDAELRLRPGMRIVPFVAFAQDGGDGRGITSFVQSGNEYPVFARIHDSTKRVRGGASFQFSKFHATLEQGGTWFQDSDASSENQRNLGDRTTPIAGQILTLTNLDEIYRIRGTSIFTRAVATYTPFSWVDLSGQFLYSIPSVDVKYSGKAGGNFVDLATTTFFGSLSDLATGAANQPHSSGALYVELRPLSRVRILDAFSTDRLHVASSVALTEVTGITPQAIAQIGADRFVMNYTRNQTEALVEVTRWLTLRAGYRRVWGDTEVRGPQVTGLQFERGELDQNVVLAGAMVRLGPKFRLNLDAEGGAADRTYFRTSLHDYKKATARARYQAFTSLALTAVYTELDNENPTPGVNYDFKNRQASLGFFWNPNGAKRYSVNGDYTYSAVKSNLGYLLPPFYSAELSRYRDYSNMGTLMIDYSPGGKRAPRLSAGGAYFKSTGSRPTTYAQPVGRLALPLGEHAQFFTEWRYYGMGERIYTFEGFRAHVFQMGLRFLK
jgi:hypothetical protein